MLESRPVLFLGNFDIVLASGIEGTRVPAQRLHLVNGALYQVAQRSRPVNCERRVQLMADFDGVLHPPICESTDLWRFRCWTSCPYRVMKRIRGDHRARHSV